ncbi:DUF4296 domain-containing protein [Chitinophaga deserti]|uniref:DUF4296 domain-containing protein n=1 Tax=Chitinophaga deserti TaxID=2164099 RepID=UPI000D6DBCFF|nr:DUF4296 domain-containing protein [Chitinophaga deserti]
MTNLRKTAYALIVAASMAACGNADRTPGDVLSKEQMRDILLDMNYADVYAREQLVDGRPVGEITEAMRDSSTKTMYAQVLLLHKVDRETFTRSYKFYEANPDRLEMIYKEMGNIVRRQREVLDSIERARTDRELRAKGRNRMDSLFWPSPDSLKLNIF